MMEKAYTSSFARIYDDIMGAVPYKMWFNYLREILEYYQQCPTKVLDLACGTGNLSLYFAKNAYQVTGVDRSADMLKLAWEKTKGLNARFVQADLRDFQLEEKYDLAFSLFDSLNYILTQEDLKKVFNNVYQALQERGVFIFDLNTLHRLMSIEPGTTVFHGDDYTCLWEDMVDYEKKRWQVRLRIHFLEEDTFYEEFHEETSYPVKLVEALLKEVGFAYTEVFNAYTFERGTDNDNRLFYVAFKNNYIPDKKRPFLRNIIWRIRSLLQ